MFPKYPAHRKKDKAPLKVRFKIDKNGIDCPNNLISNQYNTRKDSVNNKAVINPHCKSTLLKINLNAFLVLFMMIVTIRIFKTKVNHFS